MDSACRSPQAKPRVEPASTRGDPPAPDSTMIQASEEKLRIKKKLFGVSIAESRCRASGPTRGLSPKRSYTIGDVDRRRCSPLDPLQLHDVAWPREHEQGS